MDDTGFQAFEPDDPINSPDPDTSKAALEAKLREYHAAIQQEWEDGVKYTEGKLTPTEIRDKTKELLTQAVPKAVGALLYLSQHAKNETVQMRAAQYIIDKAVGKEIGNLVGDPLEALLNSLTAEKATSDSD